jgi:hypothetical protein
MSLKFRMIYKLSKYWRYYLLLLIASILSFILLYIGKNDPTLELYLPSYFKLGSDNYYYFHKNGAVENIFNLMENVTLDYDYAFTNSRYCFSDLNTNANIDDEGFRFKILFLSISESANFKNRQAARQTYVKYLKKFDLKLLFLVGKQDRDTGVNLKLKQEMNDYNDIVQINMPDNNDNYTSIKTLIGLRWAITYCPNVDYLYIVIDYAVINHKLLSKYIYTDDLFNVKRINNSVIAGFCNYTDDKLAMAIKLFFAKTSQGKRKDPTMLKQRESLAYKGQYCSNLGWVLSLHAAKKLWYTALNSNWMIKYAPAYLNGYIAHKAHLNHLNLFDYEDSVQHTERNNCLDIFQSNENKFLCAENFSIQNRYNNYIATWNTANDQHHFALSKL